MRTTLILSALWLLWAGFMTPQQEQTYLIGTVTDDKEPLIGAAVRVLQGKIVVKAALTDVEGNYRIPLAPGNYEVEIFYTGYETRRFTDVQIVAGKTQRLDAVLQGSVLSEVVITSYKVPLIEQDNTSGGQTLTSEQISKLPTRKAEAIIKTTEGNKSKMASKPALKKDAPAAPSGTLRPQTTAAPETAPADELIMVDGRKKRMEIAFEAETYEEKVILVDTEGESSEPADALVKSIAPGIIDPPKPRAGLLTGGEWNDLHNWSRHWVDLQADGEIAGYETMYGFFPRHRYTLMLSNQLDVPVADVPVQLKYNDAVIWEARTDNTGKAELWASLFDGTEKSGLLLQAWVDGQAFEVKQPLPAKKGFNFLKIPVECRAPQNVDIVWAVDATGSMGDELEYLKTELLDVIGRAQQKNPALAFRMGTAFYRDKGDEYIVKSSALSSDIQQTVGFIQQQSAGGGGDYPEAVHSALEDAVFGQRWSENAIARICFLVLDASPHQQPEVKASLQKSIQEAARRGIRIVPLTASGIQKDTEFLMKFFGLATNGTYLFLTDHSGIGGKHLEPTTDEYKVEALNDLLVRIITEYTSIETCEGKSNIRFADDQQLQSGQVLQASYYPNPAVDQFTLELPFDVQTVSLYNAEGQNVRKLEKLSSGPNIVQVSDLAAGFYTIRINHNGHWQSGKLMVVGR